MMIVDKKIIMVAIKIIIGATLLIVGLLAQSLLISIFDYTRPIRDLFLLSIGPMMTIILGALIIFFGSDFYE